MTYDEAAILYAAIGEFVSQVAGGQRLLMDIRLAAVRYAHTRVEWRLSGPAERARSSSHRTALHESFIDCCNVVGREMAASKYDMGWRRQLGDDRQRIGDFACFIHCMLGLDAR